MKAAPRQGYATVLAMLLLVLGLTLSAWLYTALSNNTAIGRNERANARSISAAESGLRYMMYEMRLTGAQARFYDHGRISILEQLRDAMVQRDADRDLNPATATAWSVTGTSAPSFSVSSVPLVEGSFTAEMTLTQKPSQYSGYTLLVTGSTESDDATSTRTLCYELSYASIFGTSALDYAIATRNPSYTKGTSGIYSLDADGNANMEDQGVFVDSGGGSVLKFTNSPDVPPDVIFPDKYLPDALYNALKAMRDTGKLRAVEGTVGSTGTTTTMSNVFVPAGKKLVVNGDVTLNGVIYCEWPSAIEFGDHVQMNGVIIYQKANSLTRSNPVLKMGRTLGLDSDLTVAHALVDQAFQNAGYSADDRAAFLLALGDWIIKAPDTDLELSNGNTTGERIFDGNFHIRNLLGAGSGTAGTDANSIKLNGQLFCEGSVDLSGNRLYAIDEPEIGDNPYMPRHIVLNVEPGGYWEK